MANPFQSPLAEAEPSASTGEEAPPSRVRWMILGVTTLASFLLYLDRICLAEVLKYDSVKETLELTDVKIAWSLSAFFWSYALGQVPGGWISDRFGARLMMTIYILSWSLFTAMTGWAIGFVMLFGLRLSVGMAQAGAYPTSGGILSRWMPIGQRGMASSVVAFGGRLGGAVAPYSTSWLISVCRGWQAVMVLYGVVGAFVAAAFWIFFRERPAEHPRANAAEQALIAYGRPAGAGAASAHRAGETAVVVRLVLRSASMWLMNLSQFTTNVGWAFLVTLLPTYLKEAQHAPDKAGGLMATVVLLVGMAGMLMGGWLTDWAARRLGLRWGRSLPLALSRFLATAAFFALPSLDSPWAATAAFAVVAFATDLGVAGTWACLQDVGGKYVGAVLGWGNMWGNLGAAVSPPLLQWVSMSSGPGGVAVRNWDVAFAVCGVSFIISGLASLGIDATKSVAPGQDE
ncbi:MAG TPA: MFS transporter [Pirellulales bacterium]|nr:MFS transporter [Pirellulales bacterium]